MIAVALAGACGRPLPPADVAPARGTVPDAGAASESPPPELATAPAPVHAYVGYQVLASPAEYGGATGIALDVRVDAGYGDIATQLSASVALHRADGTPLPEAPWMPAEARSSMLERSVYHGPVRPVVTRVFIPYVALDLVPGRHALSAHVRTRMWNGERGKAEPFEVIGPVAFEVPVDMPVVKEVRFTVGSMELERRQYDDTDRSYLIGTLATGGAGAIMVPRRRWQHADPLWRVSVAGYSAHRSAALQDRVHARWRRRTPWLPFAPGDTMQLFVDDDDLAMDQPLARWTLDPAALPARLPPDGDVRALRVTRVQVRRSPRSEPPR